MKVCTDACILGAWFALKIPDVATVLDIGSGTGLQMLMLAQKSEAEIHGIEIDLGAFKQLQQNIKTSKWKERLKVFPGDARTYRFPCEYDFIISNPPFYEKDLKADAEEANVARHSKALTFSDLIKIVDQYLLPHGSFGVLLPMHRMEEFIISCESQSLFLAEKLLIRQTPTHEYFRAVLRFSRFRQGFIPEAELVIQRDNGLYSREFTELLRPYYLNM
jgi:tRNA1Val (adenine37-N6)-methyltransferase